MRWRIILVCMAVLVHQSYRAANAFVAVPVTVSTMARSTFGVCDVSVDGNGNVLFAAADYHAVYRVAAGGTVVLIAGSGGSAYGFMNGAGSAARFYSPNGLTCDATSNIVYVSDYGHYRIRTLVLATGAVSTLAGSSTSEHVDALGTSARFYGPYGITYHSRGVLYVAERNSYIRKIVIASANVTTVALFVTAYGYGYYLAINSANTLLYVTTLQHVVLQINLSTVAVNLVAGRSGTADFVDGGGTSALFNIPQGVAFNSDETALQIVDYGNRRILRIELATNNVTTIAGSGLTGLDDGPGLNATFSSIINGAKWHCVLVSAACGVLVADNRNSAIRFVRVEGPTATAAFSVEATRTLCRFPAQNRARPP